ncbi:acyl-CoA desaturase, partial [Synechococcus sp. Cruz CV12-2-Slac-r]|nr:acyl-CoA desaturase [Synechococcus sp. Cruz CV12-2-Slac-r]
MVVAPQPSATAALNQQELQEKLYAPRGPLPVNQRKVKKGTFVFMLANHVGAVAALLPMFWSWWGLFTFAFLYWVTVLGVTLGLHRLVAHRSFETPHWLERLLVLMGTLGAQGG